MLKAEGFGVEDISAGDYQIKFEINLQSGHHVAAQSALHGFALPNDPLARNVASAIAGAFRKMSDDAADDIKQAVAAGEQTRIVEAFCRVRASGALGVRPTQALLEATFSFDPTTLPDDDRRVVRECRLMTAHLSGRWDLAGPEAEAFMREEAARLDDRQKADLSMIIANGKVQQGHRETALHIWRKLLKSPEVLGAGNRGWAWRNVALASELDNSGACHAAKCSADAFLEAGEKDEAARSLMTLANRLLGEEPEAALKIIGDIFELIEREGLKSRELRAATHHARANRLVQMGRYAEAATDAKAAADFLRGLLGIEDRLISALHLAAIAVGSAGDMDSAKAFEEEADRITNDIQSPHFLLARQISELMQDYDSARADALLRDAEEQKNHDAAVSIRVLQATRRFGEKRRREVIAAGGRSSEGQRRAGIAIPQRTRSASPCGRASSHWRGGTFGRAVSASACCQPVSYAGAPSVGAIPVAPWAMGRRRCRHKKADRPFGADARLLLCLRALLV